MNYRMSVNEAAYYMQVSPQFVRIGLQRGVFTWGYAIKTSSHYTYFINRNLFMKEMEGNK